MGPPSWLPPSSSVVQTAHHMLPDTALGQKSGPVFHNIRYLSGIVGYKTTPTPRTNNLALGPAADDYLWAHGYQQGSIQLIQRMYERATRMDGFVAELAREGVPITEGRYIFSLINTPTTM